MPRQDSNLRFRPGRSRVNTRADCVDGQQTAAPVPRMVTRVWSPAMSAVPHNMTIARAESLPPVVDVVTVAANLGIGATAAYELIRTGAWPTPVLRLGKLIRIPPGPNLELLQLRRTGS